MAMTIRATIQGRYLSALIVSFYAFLGGSAKPSVRKKIPRLLNEALIAKLQGGTVVYGGAGRG
jgi:hypothetical protein